MSEEDPIPMKCESCGSPTKSERRKVQLPKAYKEAPELYVHCQDKWHRTPWPEDEPSPVRIAVSKNSFRVYDVDGNEVVLRTPDAPGAGSLVGRDEPAIARTESANAGLAEGSGNRETLASSASGEAKGVFWTSADLDRCQHGRHSTDDCFDCTATPKNLFLMSPSTIDIDQRLRIVNGAWQVRIGTTVRAEPIWVTVKAAK